jgi:Tol biopolymer transport system component
MNFFADFYRAPVIGGTPYKVASEVSGGVFPSPDYKRLLFVRADPAAQEHKLIVVNADGTGERVISARKWPDISWMPGWSPDGQLLAYCARNHEGDQFYNTIMAVPAGGGPERPLTSGRWTDVGGTIWLPDGSGLLLTGRERLGEPFQIYHVSYPGGDVRKVTNDANSYSALSITRGSKELVAEVGELTANIWVVPEGDAARARQITHGGKDGVGGVA